MLANTLSRRHFVPPALTTPGTTPGGARFRQAAVGEGRALRGSDVDNSILVLGSLACLCEPFEVGRGILPLL